VRTSWLAALAALVLAFGCSSPSAPARAASPKASKERKPAAEFVLKDADGKAVRLADYQGKVLLLNFWATWCGPCKIEIPWLKEFERTYKDRGFAVLGISMDEEGWEVVKPFVRGLEVNYRIVIGDDMTAQLYGGVDALPTTFLIDREGRVAKAHVGLVSKGDLEKGIQELLREPAGIERAGAAARPVGAN